MASGGDKSNDFYAVLGLKKECTEADLRLAYKKLAMKWHPDRISASGNPIYVEEAKKKFQAIQQAYSVLSDGNKRFLYDVGVYDCNDDEDNNGMGEFLNEMMTMMGQVQPEENENDSFEEFQKLFHELFPDNVEGLGTCSRSTAPPTSSEAYTETASAHSTSETSHHGAFCMGSGDNQSGESSRKKKTRKGRR